MGRRIVGIVAGLIVGFVGILLVEAVSMAFYPAPADLNLSDREAMRRHLESLPVGAFVWVLAAHAVGCCAGAATCAVIVRRPWRVGSLIIGGLFLVAGIANLVMIPHPIWFALADAILYLPFSRLGGWIGELLVGSRDAGPTS